VASQCDFGGSGRDGADATRAAGREAARPIAREKAVRDLFDVFGDGPPVELPEHNAEQ
jgi:hypothetical protein